MLLLEALELSSKAVFHQKSPITICESAGFAFVCCEFSANLCLDLTGNDGRLKSPVSHTQVMAQVAFTWSGQRNSDTASELFQVNYSKLWENTHVPHASRQSR